MFVNRTDKHSLVLVFPVCLSLCTKSVIHVLITILFLHFCKVLRKNLMLNAINYKILSVIITSFSALRFFACNRILCVCQNRHFLFWMLQQHNHFYFFWWTKSTVTNVMQIEWILYCLSRELTNNHSVISVTTTQSLYKIHYQS